MISINIFSTLLGFVSMYIVGIILIYLAPVKTLQIEKKVIASLQEFLFSFLVGLAILVVIPVPIIILGITLIGTPLAILISGLLIFAMFFGTIWVESAIGYKILSTVDKKDNKRLLSLLVGRGLSTVVNFIPIVRGLYKMILSTVAVGAIVRTKYDAFPNKGKKKKKSKK
jgi:cobalamin biosynthesis protein CobD/CbiB